jgi:Archaea-specific editing domain of threonyl-tRNA synthetase
VHVDYVRYCTKKKTKAAEPIDLKRDSMEEGVILFCCTEKIDEDNPHNVVGNATLEVIKRLEMIKAKKVLIYPYAHFTNDLSSPKTAIDILIGLESSLKEQDLEVKRAPFGWYKELEMKSKGHPLSNLSITVLPDSKQKSGIFCQIQGNQLEIQD